MKFAVLITVMFLILGASLLGRATTPSFPDASPASPKSASELYGKYCSSCHGKDGRAKTLKAKFNHARDLTDRSWHDNVSDERVFNSIMNGKGKNMPAYGKKLSEQEIESLVSLVRGLKK